MVDIPSTLSVLSALAFPFRVPVTSCRANKFEAPRVWEADWAGDDGYAIANAGWNGDADGNVPLRSDDIGDSAETLSYCFFEFVLPPEYVAGSTVSLRIRARIIGEGDIADPHSITIQAFRIDDDGGPSTPLVNQTFSTISKNWTNYDLNLTSTSLVPGDRLVGTFKTDLMASSNDMYGEVGSIIFFCDIRR